MKKTEVIRLVEEKHQILYDWLDSHPDEKWPMGPEGKWNTGEHVVHLLQSEKALNKGLGFPKFILKYKFGINNRENRTYDQIVKKYQDKLVEYSGAVADISKQMPAISPANKSSFISKLDQEKVKLIKKFQKWNEPDLDTYLLPHPLLGRMTIREIVIWTAYHIAHHYEILKSKY